MSTGPGGERSLGESISRAISVVSVVTGLVISVLSFNETRQKDAGARQADAEVRKFELQKYADQRRDQIRKEQIEAAKPFLDLRQTLYLETIQNAGILANPSTHEAEETERATKRFWELFWAELGMVESRKVEAAMMALASAVTDTKSDEAARQQASLRLAHMLRDSLVESWGIENESKIGR